MLKCLFAQMTIDDKEQMIKSAVQPGQPIMLTLLGTLQRRSGGAPFQMRLQNGVATAYALPA